MLLHFTLYFVINSIWYALGSSDINYSEFERVPGGGTRARSRDRGFLHLVSTPGKKSTPGRTNREFKGYAHAHLPVSKLKATTVSPGYATIQSVPLFTNNSRSVGSTASPRGSAIRSSSLNGPINFPCGLNAKIFPSPEPL